MLITSRLKDHFNLLIGHPQQALTNLKFVDLTVFRNTGPVIRYRDYFNRFLAAALDQRIPTFNSFDGHGDMRGKQYLLDLTAANYPVIPTVELLSEIGSLGERTEYLVKPKAGADSIGLEILKPEQLSDKNLDGYLIQPRIDFEHEVSFYYLDDKFQYALYAPDKNQRWQLTSYEATKADLEFADRFIKWNNLTRGIQRVDACRLPDGSLLLMELEDLNPYLSIDLLTEKQRATFIDNLIAALKRI